MLSTILAILVIVVFLGAILVLPGWIGSALASRVRTRFPALDRPTVGMNWPALFSFRVWASSGCLALLVSFMGAIVLSAIGLEGDSSATALAVIMIVVFVFVLFAQVSDPSHVLYCPACRKRVKMGADRCHHCGVRVR